MFRSVSNWAVRSPVAGPRYAAATPRAPPDPRVRRRVSGARFSRPSPRRFPPHDDGHPLHPLDADARALLQPFVARSAPEVAAVPYDTLRGQRLADISPPAGPPPP